MGIIYMNMSVVGLQHYKGSSSSPIGSFPLPCDYSSCRMEINYISLPLYSDLNHVVPFWLTGFRTYDQGETWKDVCTFLLVLLLSFITMTTHLS